MWDYDIVYEGVPVPLFDVMVHPDGSLRIVDKKHDFTSRDFDFFLSRRPDIIVIGRGFRGKGGNGVPGEGPVRFLYNPHIRKGTQVLVLPTPEAVQRSNQLRREKKRVLVVLHTTC